MDNSGINPISPRLHEIFQSNPNAYEQLVVDGGTPSTTQALLKSLTPDELLAGAVKSRPHAYSMLAGLWLWFDGLTESHEIAQADPRNLRTSAESQSKPVSRLALAPVGGSSDSADLAFEEKVLPDAGKCLAFWHAVMHRREGDFSNSKYWYAKVGSHLILPAIGAQVGAAINHLPADKSMLRLLRDGWNPDALVDLVEEMHEHPDDPRAATVVAIQKVEWQLLFEHCTRQASGS